MTLLAILFFLLKQEMIIPVYEYHVLEEIRYVEVEGGKDVLLTLQDRQIKLDNNKKVDLENYYPISLISITATSFQKITFYHDDEKVASVSYQNKKDYTPLDYHFSKYYCRQFSLTKRDEEIGFSWYHTKYFKISLLNLSTFVERIVQNPRIC